MLEAVIFDLDGTLVDSEQHGHRLAFNEAFRHFDLPDRWDEDRYRQLLATTGGERRLFGWLSSPESTFSTRPEPERRQMAQDLHRWKTDRFAAMAAAGEIPARHGVFDWLDALGRHQVRLAVATTGSRRWVLPLLDKTFGADRFEVVVAGDDVAHRKPDPEAYLRTLERLGVTATQAVAVEDSRPGWESAANAHVTCVVVANEETDVTSATGPAGPPLVLDGFGAAAGVIADRFGVVKSGRGPAEMLEQLLARAIMEP
jgi:HAD superfamily hydrolase (TIGR01509 family)